MTKLLAMAAALLMVGAAEAAIPINCNFMNAAFGADQIAEVGNMEDSCTVDPELKRMDVRLPDMKSAEGENDLPSMFAYGIFMVMGNAVICQTLREYAHERHTDPDWQINFRLESGLILFSCALDLSLVDASPSPLAVSPSRSVVLPEIQPQTLETNEEIQALLLRLDCARLEARFDDTSGKVSLSGQLSSEADRKALIQQISAIAGIRWIDASTLFTGRVGTTRSIACCSSQGTKCRDGRVCVLFRIRTIRAGRCK